MHPFKFIDERFYFRMLFLSLLFCFMVMFGMQWSEFFLTNDVAPKGIVSFELAKNYGESLTIINSWKDANVIAYAGFNLGLDFLFLLFYPIVIGLAIVLLANGFKEGHILRGTGFVVSWLVIFGGLLDAAENVALINLLTGSIRITWSLMAYYFAVTKFIIVGLGIGYIIVGGIGHGIQKALNS